MLRGEEADLDREPQAESGRGGDVGAEGCRAVAEREQDDERRDRHCGGEDDEIGVVVEDEAGRVAEAVVSVSRGLVAAEDAAERAAIPQPPARPRERRHDERDHRGRERENRAPTPSKQRIENGRRDDDRQEDERLEPRHRGDRAGSDEERLPAEGRPLERPRQREGGQDDGRVEEDLGHDQARVRDAGDRERQQDGDERPAA